MVTEYPSGLIPLCLLLGAGYAYFLYYHDLKRGMRSVTVWGMTILRFLSVSLISFLVLSPLVRHSETRVEKPMIVIGVDNSKSVVLTGDSDYYRKTFPGQVNELVAKLQRRCDVRLYSFDSRLSNGFNGVFNGSKTDISLFFNEISTRYSNRNAAAVVLASDGIYNEGTDPYYAAQKIQFPVYTISLGDTSLKKDISIRKITVNKTAYKGDKFPVEVQVEMNKCSGLKPKISISQGSRILDSREVRANSDRSLQKVTFMLDAPATGMIKYSLNLDETEGEMSRQNNHAEFLVEVLESRQKIALVSDAPHPDITAIQKALEGSSHFEIEMMGTEALARPLDKYDLVILNQVPYITSLVDIGTLMRSKVSLLVIIGSQTDINAFNRMQAGLIINSARSAFSESQPSFNPGFSLFTMDN
ncbi:MAG: hypothetical protein WCK63_18855, partial [Betaproteobacteria bacterium]